MRGVGKCGLGGGVGHSHTKRLRISSRPEDRSVSGKISTRFGIFYHPFQWPFPQLHPWHLFQIRPSPPTPAPHPVPSVLFPRESLAKHFLCCGLLSLAFLLGQNTCHSDWPDPVILFFFLFSYFFLLLLLSLSL